MSEDADRPVIGPDSKPPSEQAGLPPGGRYITFAADVEAVDGHLKRARGGTAAAGGGPPDETVMFEILSDEPEYLGGSNQHPQPLLYITAGIGF